MKKLIILIVLLISTVSFAQNRALRIDSLEVNDKNITGFINDLLSTDLMEITLDSLVMFTVSDSSDSVWITDNGTYVLVTSDNPFKFSSDIFISNSLRVKTYNDDDIDDDDTYNLPDGAFGHGIVFISNDTNEEGGIFGFYDDNPYLISVSANCQEADADNKLVIMDGGDTVTIKNTLGDNYKLTLIIWYYIP